MHEAGLTLLLPGGGCNYISRRCSKCRRVKEKRRRRRKEKEISLGCRLDAVGTSVDEELDPVWFQRDQKVSVWAVAWCPDVGVLLFFHLSVISCVVLEFCASSLVFSCLLWFPSSGAAFTCPLICLSVSVLVKVFLVGFFDSLAILYLD